MKILNLTFAVVICTILSGCATGGQAPQTQNLGGDLAAIKFPKTINYGGEIYTAKYGNEVFTEYYLNGEEGYKWTKLLTVISAPQVTRIDDYVEAIKYAQNARKGEFKIKKLSEDSSYREEIYYPVPNSEFKAYEVTIDVSKITKCGLISVSFARNFKTLKDLRDALKSEKFNEKFLANVPEIPCK